VKKITFILIVVLFLKPVFPFLDYAINYEYITKVLCENKAKPEMHCNGKCHLMKELAKASDSEKPLSTDKKASSQLLEVLFLEEIQSYAISPIYFVLKQKTAPSYSNLYSHLNTHSIFHPPIFIS
jgi:hypothetical protein